MQHEEQTQAPISADAMFEALNAYASDERLCFETFWPFPAGYEFSPRRMRGGLRAAAFVLNTTAGEGSHWVVLYADLVEGALEYFDSLGEPPNAAVRRTIRSIVDTLSRFAGLPPNRPIAWSSVAKQTGSTECGVFVVWFVVRRLEGCSFRDLVRAPFGDADCLLLRDVHWPKRARSRRCAPTENPIGAIPPRAAREILKR
ncbi:Hypothetical protein UVM_LOCUS396 [uncultured virus]|nr:Hypothetical protein UVM_LOCUS396 [uncultured virus]